LCTSELASPAAKRPSASAEGSGLFERSSLTFIARKRTASVTSFSGSDSIRSTPRAFTNSWKAWNAGVVSSGVTRTSDALNSEAPGAWTYVPSEAFRRRSSRPPGIWRTLRASDFFRSFPR
jgi:hypothetical protein